MALPRPTATPWLTIKPNESSTVTVASQIYWWTSHWDETARRTRRCPGPETCQLCADGIPAQLRFVLGVKIGQNRYTLELRERHRPILQLLDQHPAGPVGAVIRLQKLGAAVNSPVQVEYRRHERNVPEWHLQELVNAFGLAPIETRATELELIENDAPDSEGENRATGTDDA